MQRIASYFLEPERILILILRTVQFIQPSRYEGKSVVLDEAKILAVPIVATAYPTVGDQLQDKVEGMVVPMNPEGIAQGLTAMLEDERWERLTQIIYPAENMVIRMRLRSIWS